jgi:type IV pilus assembly protein PilP
MVNNKLNKSPSKIEPLPLAKQFETYTYDATRLRDPFVTEGGEIASVEKCPQITRARTTLEQSPLDSLAMVGSMKQHNERWALVKDRENNVHRIKTGDFLGQNNGKITKITDAEIVLQELVSDRMQGCIERKTILAISD